MRHFFQDPAVRIGFWFTFHVFLFITGSSGLIILLAKPTGKLGVLALLVGAALLVLLLRHSTWTRALSVHVSTLGGLSAIVLNNHPGYLAFMALIILLTQLFAIRPDADEAPYAVTGRINHLGAALSKVRSIRD